jgi:hypothetical protein
MSIIIIDIIEEHLEEADFLSRQRGNALGDRAYNLSRFSELEERLLAHLDVLVLAESDAWNLLKPKLTEGDRGEAYAAAFVALVSGEVAYRDELTKALDQAEGPVDRTHVCGRYRAGVFRRGVCPLPLERQLIWQAIGISASSCSSPHDPCGVARRGSPQPDDDLRHGDH